MNVVNDLHVIAEALQRLDAALHSSRLAPPRRRVIIFGGAAVLLHAVLQRDEGPRVTKDIDVSLSVTPPSPRELVPFQFYSLHAWQLVPNDYEERLVAFPALGKFSSIDVYVLSPIDLIVLKLCRFRGRDDEDIERLCRIYGLTWYEVRPVLDATCSDSPALSANSRNELRQAVLFAFGVEWQPPEWCAANDNLLLNHPTTPPA